MGRGEHHLPVNLAYYPCGRFCQQLYSRYLGRRRLPLCPEIGAKRAQHFSFSIYYWHAPVACKTQRGRKMAQFGPIPFSCISIASCTALWPTVAFPASSSRILEFCNSCYNPCTHQGPFVRHLCVVNRNKQIT